MPPGLAPHSIGSASAWEGVVWSRTSRVIAAEKEGLRAAGSPQETTVSECLTLPESGAEARRRRDGVVRSGTGCTCWAVEVFICRPLAT
jgi:hypothetical protein